MKSNAATQNARKRKRCKRERLVDGEDRISNLPENIIGYILSFLPTKEAVRTCILSTKWIYNWTFMTHLHFDDRLLSSQKQKKSKQAHFVNIVDKAVRLLADSSIKSFFLSLLCHNNYELSQVNEWMSAILEAKLQRLHICYAEQVLFSSHSLFTCSTLVQLVLWVNCSLTLPASVCLPNLIYLSFSGITFVSDSSAHSTDIILGFPVLREFKTRDCKWLTEQDVSIQAPLLESCFIAFQSFYLKLCEPFKCAIKICALKLSEFCFYGDPLLEIMIVNPSSVRNVFIEILKIEGRKVTLQDMARRTTMLLRQFPQVENLKLWTYIVKLLRHAKGILPNLPEFGRLTYLHLNKARMENLIRLLHKAPILKTLVILQGTYGKSVLNDETVPLCLLSSLKLVKYGLSSGDEAELCLMKYVLENAAVLERMIVYPSRMGDTSEEKKKDLAEKMKQVQMELLLFPKCSDVASIEFTC